MSSGSTLQGTVQEAGSLAEEAVIIQSKHASMDQYAFVIAVALHSLQCLRVYVCLQCLCISLPLAPFRVFPVRMMRSLERSAANVVSWLPVPMVSDSG